MSSLAKARLSRRHLAVRKNLLHQSGVQRSDGSAKASYAPLHFLCGSAVEAWEHRTRCGTALLLSVVAGYSASEIAPLLSLNETTVRQRLSRARKAFQRLYA